MLRSFFRTENWTSCNATLSLSWKAEPRRSKGLFASAAESAGEDPDCSVGENFPGS